MSRLRDPSVVKIFVGPIGEWRNAHESWQKGEEEKKKTIAEAEAENLKEAETEKETSPKKKKKPQDLCLLCNTCIRTYLMAFEQA
jgi:hypothetical protein